MKFGCSLEMVNMLTSGPNFIYKQSKNFWTGYLKYVAAVGFKGIELPFNPFSSDPMAFETGRCGIPVNAGIICAKYGSYEEFLVMLNSFGIDEVTSVHINANDAMLELVAANRPAEDYFSLFESMAADAVEHTAQLKCSGLVVSPSPELGWLKKYFPDGLEEFEKKTVEILRGAVESAAKSGIKIAIKTEYWSYFRGPKTAELLKNVPGARLSPDLAHLHIAGDPVLKVIEAHKDDIDFIRVSDTDFEDKYENYGKINAEIPVVGRQRVFSDLGEGKVDIKGVIKILDDNNYDGWVICEQKKTLDVYRGLLKLGWYVGHELKTVCGEGK